MGPYARNLPAVPIVLHRGPAVAISSPSARVHDPARALPERQVISNKQQQAPFSELPRPSHARQGPGKDAPSARATLQPITHALPVCSLARPRCTTGTHRRPVVFVGHVSPLVVPACVARQSQATANTTLVLRKSWSTRFITACFSAAVWAPPAMATHRSAIIRARLRSGDGHDWADY